MGETPRQLRSSLADFHAFQFHHRRQSARDCRGTEVDHPPNDADPHVQLACQGGDSLVQAASETAVNGLVWINPAIKQQRHLLGRCQPLQGPPQRLPLPGSGALPGAKTLGPMDRS